MVLSAFLDLHSVLTEPPADLAEKDILVLSKGTQTCIFLYLENASRCVRLAFADYMEQQYLLDFSLAV